MVSSAPSAVLKWNSMVRAGRSSPHWATRSGWLFRVSASWPSSRTALSKIPSRFLMRAKLALSRSGSRTQ
jgi:hypothetical protein